MINLNYRFWILVVFLILTFKLFQTQTSIQHLFGLRNSVYYHASNKPLIVTSFLGGGSEAICCNFVGWRLSMDDNSRKADCQYIKRFPDKQANVSLYNEVTAGVIIVADIGCIFSAFITGLRILVFGTPAGRQNYILKFLNVDYQLRLQP